MAHVRYDVDLYSDSKTQPSPEMRAAMASAEVGDEQAQEDPTVSALEVEAAGRLGQEAAVLMASGTMGNVVAAMLHAGPGDGVIAHFESHPVRAEVGAMAVLARAMPIPLRGEGGMFTAGDLDAAALATSPRQPRPKVVFLEQTTNVGGGRVWPLAQWREVLSATARNGLRSHLDGARLFNAEIASGVSAAQWAAGFDTTMIDFSKGLGAPFGAILAGSTDVIADARRLRQMLGGGLRQAGIMAAGARYALERNIARLADDHARARRLAKGLAELPAVALDPRAVQTNIVVFKVPYAHAFCAALEDRGVRMCELDRHRVRAVTHLDIDDRAITRALTAVREIALG